jgi:signal transduction histidine kinase
MLDLSKLESNKLEMTITKNSLSTLTQASVDKMKLLFAGKGVALTYTGHDATISTDADKFDRILVNLLSNAYKFTPGGGKVTVTTTISQSDHLATICVADTGIGIPKEGRDNLFKKFSQVDNYLQRQSGGTGLGLSICKGLVEKLGGKIWVDSTAGQGSEFYFTVPLSIEHAK